MARDLYCPHCSTWAGNCGHVAGGSTSPTTISTTCRNCNRSITVTCSGDCL